MASFANDIEPASDNDELNRSGLSEPGMTSSGSLRTNPAGAAMMAPATEPYSNESTPLLTRSDQFRVGIISGNYDADDREFVRIFCDAEQAVDHGIYPQRISQGSSGSYFVKNSDGVGILINVVSVTKSNRHRSDRHHHHRVAIMGRSVPSPRRWPRLCACLQ